MTAVPENMAVTPPLAVAKRGFAKKWLMRIGEKVGTVETTSYTPELLDLCKELELYKVSLQVYAD